MQTMQYTTAAKGLPSTQAELDACTAAAIKAEKQRRRKDNASGDTTRPARTPWDSNFKGKHNCKVSIIVTPMDGRATPQAATESLVPIIRLMNPNVIQSMTNRRPPDGTW